MVCDWQYDLSSHCAQCFTDLVVCAPRDAESSFCGTATPTPGLGKCGTPDSGSDSVPKNLDSNLD